MNKVSLISSKIDRHVDEVVERMCEAPWDDVEFYKEYIAQTYYYVFYSCRMLAAAAALTDAAQNDYYKRLLQHLREESGHEALALKDLKNLGGRIEDHPELGITRALWEPQFFKIQRQATSLLGYVLALELLAIRFLPKLTQTLESLYGKESTSFFRVHAAEDPDHVEKAIAQVQKLPIEEQAAVWNNYEQTCMVFRCLVDEVTAAVEKRSGHAHKPNRELRRAG